MGNRVVDVLNSHCEHWRSLIPMLESGVIRTREMRDGKQVDTTDETLAKTQRLLAETEELIRQIEASDAKGA